MIQDPSGRAEAKDPLQGTRKRITIVTPCFNEEGNVRPLRQAVLAVFERDCPQFDHDHIFVDNASRDGTQAVLREMASQDLRVKVILNTRNFGHIRSPHHGLLQAEGDAALFMAADFQDPPELIPELLARWEHGYKVVLAVKKESDETPLMFTVRRVYYELVSRLSEIELVKDATGFGVYDRTVIEVLRRIDDPYPYFRGLISDLGFEADKVPFKQPLRRRGITKNNFYTLYDMAMLGFTNHSKVPLRLMALGGFVLATLSLGVAFGYLIAKLLWWDEFELGFAPMIIGFFFFSAIQLFSVGIIGEYIGAIHTQVRKRPLVIEKERINF